MDTLPKNILLVEDEAIIGLMEKRWLQAEGFEVKIVTNGLEAIEAAMSDHDSPDLILMDIDLGHGIDGTQAAREILKQRDIPLLFLSSHTEKEIVEKTEQISSYGYVVKGSTNTVLLASIKMAFKLFKANSELKLSREAHHKSEESLSITLNSIGDGVIATDTLGTVTRMNPAAEKMCGWTLEESKGRPLPEVFNIVNAITGRKVTNPVELVLKTGKVVGLANHTVLISKQKARYQIFDSAAPICDDKGECFGVVLVFSDVTEKYKKEEQLKESEERLRFALEGTNDGLWDVNMQTNEVYISPRGCELLGYKPDEMHELVRVWSELVNPEDLPLTNQKLESYLKKETDIFQVEQRLKTKQGTWKWILTRGKAVGFDPLGSPLRMTGTHTDISLRKNAEEAFLQSEERFKLLFDRAPLGYQSLDDKGCFIEVNQTWLETLGYSREEVIGKWFGDFLTPGYKDAFRKRFEMFKSWGKVHSEFEMIRKDGQVVFIAFEGRIGYTDEGSFKQTHCILNDITEKKRSEELAYEKARQYKLLFDSSIDAVFLTNPDGNITAANPAACLMLGMSEPEIINSGRDGIVDASDSRLARALEERNNTGRFFGELVLIRKDGTRFPAEVSSSIFLDSDNNKNACTIIRDITARKATELKLQTYSEELKNLNETKNKLFSIISHDLRGPFSGLMGLTEDLNKEIDSMSKNEIAEIAGVMHETTMKVNELLVNLLEWSRLQSGLLELKPQKLNLFAEAENIKSLYISSSVSKSVEIINETDAFLHLFADKNMLAVVLRNLVDNAVKFTMPGGRIIIDAKKDEISAEISIINSNPESCIPESPITADEKVSGLIPGLHTDGTKGEKGSGLGLLLCQDLIKKAGSQMTSSPVRGGGMRFSFSLPLFKGE